MRKRKFADSPLEGNGFEPSVPGGYAAASRRTLSPVSPGKAVWSCAEKGPGRGGAIAGQQLKWSTSGHSALTSTAIFRGAPSTFRVLPNAAEIGREIEFLMVDAGF